MQIKVQVADRKESGGKVESVSFRKLLLTKCQKEFEKDKTDELGLEELQKAISEAKTVSALSLSHSLSHSHSLSLSLFLSLSLSLSLSHSHSLSLSFSHSLFLSLSLSLTLSLSHSLTHVVSVFCPICECCMVVFCAFCWHGSQPYCKRCDTQFDVLLIAVPRVIIPYKCRSLLISERLLLPGKTSRLDLSLKWLF